MSELRQYLRHPSSVSAESEGEHIVPASVRGLFARLTRGQERQAAAAAPAGDLPCESAGDRRLRALRADAEAAYRCTDAAGAEALTPALAVMEGEIARLRSTVETYGEALKTLRIYGADAGQRAIAAEALRAAPCELRASQPVPRLL